MAFLLGNQIVLDDTESGHLSKLQINGTDVLTLDGSTITLKNVDIADSIEGSINSDNVAEGSTNRFFTAAREAVLTTADSTATTDRALIRTEFATADTGITTALQSYADTAEADAISTAAATAASLDTTQTAANKLVWEAYADSAVTGGTGALDTDDITEAGNLYYTNARVDTHLSTDMGIGGASGNAELSGTLRVTGNIFPTNASTSDLGTTGGQHFNFVNANNINLYDNKIYFNKNGNHTELRAQGTSSDILISLPTTTGTLALTSYVDTAVANIVDSAPAALDTLNELAAALGDDANHVTTMTNLVSGNTTLINNLTHDGFTDFVANEHIDWTSASAGTIHASNYTSSSSYGDSDVGTLFQSYNFHILPDTNNTYDIGSASFKIRDLYVSDNSIHIGDNTLRTSGPNLLLNGEDVMDYNNLKNKVASEHIDWTAASAGTIHASNYSNTNTGILSVVEDTTPQLGGNLDLQTHDITTSENDFAITTGSGSDITTIEVGTLSTATLTGGGLAITSSTNAGQDIVLLGDLNFTSGLVTGEVIGMWAFDNPTNISSNVGLAEVLINGTVEMVGCTLSDSASVIFGNLGTANEVGLAVGTSSDARIHQLDASGDTIFKFPAADGTANQVIETNGAGDLSWVTHTDTNTNTTYTAGNGLNLNTTEFEMSGSYTGSFTATGDVTAYSDERLKRNIETINKPIDIVNALRGVKFEKDGRHSTGVIAQEVEKVLPEVVHTDNDGMKSVAYGNISGVLIEAIKEQQKTIESLQKQLTDLQTLYMLKYNK